MDGNHKIVFDIELMRPACVLIQAAMGGDPVTASAFPSETWLLVPTPGMTLYEVTPVQLRALVAKVCARPHEAAG